MRSVICFIGFCIDHNLTIRKVEMNNRDCKIIFCTAMTLFIMTLFIRGQHIMFKNMIEP